MDKDVLGEAQTSVRETRALSFSFFAHISALSSGRSQTSSYYTNHRRMSK